MEEAKICENCGTPFTRRFKCRLKNQKYCSVKCSRSVKMTPETKRKIGIASSANWTPERKKALKMIKEAQNSWVD